MNFELQGQEAAALRQFGSVCPTIADALRRAIHVAGEAMESKRRASSMELVAKRQADYLSGLVEHINRLTHAIETIALAQIRPTAPDNEATLSRINITIDTLTGHLEVLGTVLTEAVMSAAIDRLE